VKEGRGPPPPRIVIRSVLPPKAPGWGGGGGGGLGGAYLADVCDVSFDMVNLVIAERISSIDCGHQCMYCKSYNSAHLLEKTDQKYLRGYVDFLGLERRAVILLWEGWRALLMCRGGAGVHRSDGNRECRRNRVRGRRQVPSGGHHDCQPQHPRFKVPAMFPLPSFLVTASTPLLFI
jgi:hypothetical protein